MKANNTLRESTRHGAPRRRGLSLIVPAPNDHSTAQEIYDSIKEQAQMLHVDWELLFVRDDKCSETLLIDRLVEEDSDHVQALRVADSSNRTAALVVGYRASKGELVFTLESDQHDDPSELSRFLGRINWQASVRTSEPEERTSFWQNILPRGVLGAVAA